MECNINISDNGSISVRGVNTPLFKEAMLRTNFNEEESLKIWSIAETEGFKEFKEPSTYNNVLKYIDFVNRVEATPFNPTELSDSMNASIGNVFFQEDFNTSFTNENGDFEISYDRIKNVGLYSVSEINNIINSPTIQKNIKSFYNKSQNFEAPITTSEARVVVKSEEDFTSLGFLRRENPDQVSRTLGEIFAGVRNLEDFENRKLDLDENWEVKYEDVVDLQNSVATAQYVDNPISGDLELKVFDDTLYQTLYGVEIGEGNEKAIEIIDMITSLSPNELENTSDVKFAFNTLSKELAKSGVDFVGIENQYGEIPSPKIIELLHHTKNILSNPNVSELTVQNYVDAYNEVFEKEEGVTKKKILNTSKNNISIETSKSDVDLFVNNSLIKVKEGVYKKINRNYSNIYESLYSLMKKGGKQIVTFDVNKSESSLYKDKIIRDLQAYGAKNIHKINNSSVNASQDELMEMFLLTEYFKENEAVPDVKTEYRKFETLNSLRDVDSWKQRFIVKMNKEIISQKFKGNELPLSITQRGIELSENGDFSLNLIKNSISNSLYSDLVKYGLLTNQNFSAIEENVGVDENNVDFQRNRIANNPDLIEEYEGVLEQGKNTDLRAYGGIFIKVGGVIYEKIKNDVYGLVTNQGEQIWSRSSPNITTTPAPIQIQDKFVKQSPSLTANPELIDSMGNLEAVEVSKNVSSETFNTLYNIPLLTENEALKAYKNIYSNKMFDWKNQTC